MICPCITAMQRDPECPYHGRDSLRARIAEAYDDGTGVAWAQVSAGQVPRESEERRNRIDAIAATLPEADRDEVGNAVFDAVNGAIRSHGVPSYLQRGDAMAAADVLLSRYHLIPRGDA